MKTSQSGQFFSVMAFSLFRSDCASRHRVGAPLLRKGESRLTYPGAVFVRVLALLDALAVTGSVARDHALEFGPVDLAVFPVAGLFVLFQIRVGKGSPR